MTQPKKLNLSELNEALKPVVGHAMVQRDGYTVPLIGIPADAVMEECDCCHNILGLSKLTWTGKQMLCSKCRT